VISDPHIYARDLCIATRIPEPHPLLFPLPTSLKVELNVKNRTETLEVRSLALIFRWGRPIARAHSLSMHAGRGTLILEFLRGTW